MTYVVKVASSNPKKCYLKLIIEYTSLEEATKFSEDDEFFSFYKDCIDGDSDSEFKDFKVMTLSEAKIEEIIT